MKYAFLRPVTKLHDHFMKSFSEYFLVAGKIKFCRKKNPKNENKLYSYSNYNVVKKI